MSSRRRIKIPRLQQCIQAKQQQMNTEQKLKKHEHEVVLECNAHSTRQALILVCPNPSHNRAPLLLLVVLVLGNTLGCMLVRKTVPFWVNLHRPWHPVVINGESPGREGRPNG